VIEILKISLICYIFYALGEEGKIFHWYRKLVCRLPEWLCRPLGGCYICLTGQVCLWYGIFTKPFDIVELLFFCSAGIFASMVWNYIYEIIES